MNKQLTCTHKSKRFVASLLILFSFNIVQAQPLSDEFSDKNSLQNWKRFYLEEGWPDMMKRIEIKEGCLEMEPWTSGWYADYHAPFVFKEIAGNFSVETRLLVSGVDSVSPTSIWSLSGLMIRAPRTTTSENWIPKGENWIFLTTGVARSIDRPVFETKTTVNSKSTLKLHPNKLDWVQLRIARTDTVFALYFKYDQDDDWTQIEQFSRPDLPQKLQVGINTYTDFYSAKPSLMKDLKKYNTTVVKYGKPDLLVRVDYVRFKSQ